MQPNILEFKKVTKKFPGVTALSEVSFDVKEGEILGLCGENGAGKSTLMKILSGVYPHGSYEGEIYLQGELIKNNTIHEAIKKGIAIVYQELALVSGMTVGENVFLGREPLRGGVINWNKLYSDTRKILEKYGLKIPYSEPVKSLGVGKQQMVEIAKALSEDAKILILDEPTSALTEAEVDALMGIIGTLKENGVTCIYISHKLEEIFRITDRITVIRDGKVIGTRLTGETDTEELIKMMVGRDMTEQFPPKESTPGETVLEVRNLSSWSEEDPDKKRINDISFSLRGGEILGISGLMGSGRSELVLSLFGEYGSRVEGDILIDGKKVKITSARQAMKNRISLVPEDRKALGLVLGQSILENLALPNLDRFSRFFSIDRLKELRDCEDISASLSVKCSSTRDIVNSLSGGNQQKVVISKWLLSDPRVLILDEPTRGIDVGAKYEIYKLMNKLAAQGVAIIMVSSELPEILGMSDRVLVICEGKCAGILDREACTQEKIMTLATGVGRKQTESEVMK